MWPDIFNLILDLNHLVKVLTPKHDQLRLLFNGSIQNICIQNVWKHSVEVIKQQIILTNYQLLRIVPVLCHLGGLEFH